MKQTLARDELDQFGDVQADQVGPEVGLVDLARVGGVVSVLIKKDLISRPQKKTALTIIFLIITTALFSISA